MTPRHAIYRADPWGAHTLARYGLLMVETQEMIHRTMLLIEESRELLRRFELASAASSHLLLRPPNVAPDR
jgi:hypothetical protein